MSFEKGNKRCQEHNNEKWEACHSRGMPQLWHKDVQNWKSLGSIVFIRIIEGAGQDSQGNRAGFKKSVRKNRDILIEI
jgi:hypothetical protein